MPGSPVVITPDTARGVNFKGALVYTSDLEGKITKFNLTNMTHEPAAASLGQTGTTGNQINLYDSTTLFTAGSNSTNQRYMFHSMDATIGGSTNKLWLYAGTGNYERIANKSAGVENLMLGINDPWYPQYKDIHTTIKNIVETLIGRRLYETYYYDRFYFPGQELKKHIDRPACEISVTVHVSTNLKENWPIWIKTPDTFTDNSKMNLVSKGENRFVDLEPGDGMVYKGCERPHWRDPMPGLSLIHI